MYPTSLNNNPHNQRFASSTQPGNHLLQRPATRFIYNNVNYNDRAHPQNHIFPNGTGNPSPFIKVVGAAPGILPSAATVSMVNGERAVPGMSAVQNMHMGQRTAMVPVRFPATPLYGSRVLESPRINRKRVHDDSTNFEGKKPCVQPTNSAHTSANDLARRVLPLPTLSPALLHLKASSETSTRSVPDELSQQILDLYQNCQQQARLFQQKDQLRESLQCEIRKLFPYCNIFLVGSTVNGFGSRTSDGDLCLVLREQQINQRTEALQLLQQVLRIMWRLPYMEKMQLIRAKVPIVKFRDKTSRVEFDLNANNIIGIRNTFLLQAYSKVDQRVKPLILVIKQWAMQRSINDASQGTLSSYSLVLMVLHFLQTLPEPVVPCLQKEYPGLFNSRLQIWQIPISANSVPTFTSKSKLTLGELLLGFFKYYTTTFDWEHSIISLREGRIISRTLDDEWRNKYICIEEPFDQSNTARAVYEKCRFDKIKEEFRKASTLLEDGKNIDKILLAS
uniref:polynucleotide adenylyltransferase n=1 Tax=Petromyzon marinus TaxID=7757 RepID=A0AAJ7TV00_PETMA|nr:poly(A) RNA polymerase GLD2 [Petromyzon marinus]